MVTQFSVSDILMGRDREFPLTGQMYVNVAMLRNRINPLLAAYGKLVKLTSGYRPGRYNLEAKGSKTSPHLTCEAVDLYDPDGELAAWLTIERLEEFDLYMEDPAHTKGWVHLQVRKTKSGKRIFKP